jgi:maltose O-acetyltransferase
MPSELEKMLAGELYDAADARLSRMRERARALFSTYNGTAETDREQRRALLSDLLAKGGATANIQPPFFCDYGSNIELGQNVFMNFNCVLLDVCRIRIGSFAQIAPAVQIYTPLHPLDAATRRKVEYGKPVDIGDDVWIGGGAIICPGVTIGSRTVIGAGSVVTRDIPADVFAAGNPCRVIRKLP